MEADLIKRAKLAEKRKEKLRFSMTRAEENVMKLLTLAGEEFIFQEAFFDEWYFLIADFWLPKRKLIIEVDGHSHDSKEKKKQEAKRRRWLKKKGIGVIRIKNKATYQMTPKVLLDRIKRAERRNKIKKMKI